MTTVKENEDLGSIVKSRSSHFSDILLSILEVSEWGFLENKILKLEGGFGHVIHSKFAVKFKASE